MKQALVVSGLIVALFVFTGCSSNIPALIKQAPPDNIQVKEAQQQPEAFIGSRIRWGGQIIAVENLKDTTEVELLSRPLSDSGKPNTESKSLGRFKLRLDGFSEPEDFPKDRLMTVNGRIIEVSDGQVGEYPYLYPIVEEDVHYIWPVEREYPDHYHDPFYYPWYPWYRYPYYY